MKTKFFILLAISIISIGSISAQEGYEKSIEIGGSLGADEYSNYGINISMVNGYRINENYYIGFGLGYKYSESVYTTSSDYIGSSYQGFSKTYNSKNLAQIFARFKASLSDNKIAPFCQLDLGGSIDCSADDTASSTGVMLEPAIGVSFNGKDPSSALYLTVGYNLQGVKYTYTNNYPSISSMGDYEKSRMIGQLAVKLGFVF